LDGPEPLVKRGSPKLVFNRELHRLGEADPFDLGEISDQPVGFRIPNVKRHSGYLCISRR
jgi:hypothetical protein